MSNLSWQIGNVRVTRVEESCSTFPYIGLFPNVSEEDWRGHLDWLQPGFADAEGNLVLSVHGLVVESQGRTILVDTCMGPHQVEGIPSPEHSPFLENLEAAGFPLDSIDVVLCTHMHFDHVGWNTREVDGRWVPTFPRARYLFARVEWEHWSREKELGFAATLNESVRPLIDADQADSGDPGDAIPEPTPAPNGAHYGWKNNGPYFKLNTAQRFAALINIVAMCGIIAYMINDTGAGISGPPRWDPAGNKPFRDWQR